MYLRELIATLKAEPRQDKVIRNGFGEPMSYRGYYHDLAFEPEQNVTVASMLKYAESAMGSTFTGYKGGKYLMGEWTECWLATYSMTGETLGPFLLKLMLADEVA